MHTCRADLQTEGLQDNCDRCRELADHPGELDQHMLADLVRRTLSNRFGAYKIGDDFPEPTAFGFAEPPRSETEAIAMANVLTLLERVGRLAGAAGPEIALYLRERWRIDASIGTPLLISQP